MVVNSLAESSDNYSVIIETKSSSGEQLKTVEEFCMKEDDGDVLYEFLVVTLVAFFVPNFTDFFVIGGEQHLLHLRVCVTCFVSFAGVQGRDGVEAMEPGHGDSGTGHGSCCVQNLEFPE